MLGTGWELLLLVGSGVAELLAIAVALLAFWMTRVHFAGYIRRNHPEQWERLVPQSFPEQLTTMNALAFDASTEMSRFRANSSDDLGDAEIRIRRRRANWTLKLVLWSWAAGAAWIVLACVLLAVC
jgi:hypothetical protein